MEIKNQTTYVQLPIFAGIFLMSIHQIVIFWKQ